MAPPPARPDGGARRSRSRAGGRGLSGLCQNRRRRRALARPFPRRRLSRARRDAPHRGKRRVLRVSSVRMAAIGQSATVALVYLSLIENCLPRLAARRDHRGGHVPLLLAPDALRSLRAPAGSRTPRVLFSRASDPGAWPSLLWRPGALVPAASAASSWPSRRARHCRHYRPSPRCRRLAPARGQCRSRYPPASRPTASVPRPPCPAAGPEWR